jgi:hypothetical protein
MTISLVFQGVSWTFFTNSTPFALSWAAKSDMPLVSFAGLNILGSGTQSTGRKLVNRDDSGGARGASFVARIVGGNRA